MLEMYSRDAWVRMLVDTRNIIIVPAANALGYAKNRREENNVDPNRCISRGPPSRPEPLAKIGALLARLPLQGVSHADANGDSERVRAVAV